MAEKIFNARFQQKHDTPENWAKATNFKPLEGEFVVYDATNAHGAPRIKVGYNNKKVEELPFFFENFTGTELDTLLTNRIITSVDEYSNIYNNGLGYKDGYRVHSDGAEQATEYATCTGYIKVGEGDKIAVSGMPWFTGTSSANALNVADAAFVNIGQFTTGQDAKYGIFESAFSNYAAASVKVENGTWTWAVPAGANIAYVRISVIDPTSAASGRDLIVTVNGG